MWVEVARNLSPNPVPRDSKFVLGTWNADYGMREVAEFPSGRASRALLKVEVPAGVEGVGSEWQVPVTSGEVGFSVWVKCSVQARFGIRSWFMTNDNAVVDVVTSPLSFKVDADVPTRVWLPARTVIGDAKSIKVRVFNASGEGSSSLPPGTEIYVGSASTALDYPWFSGDHAPDGMRSEWLGEPNNSASVLYELQ